MCCFYHKESKALSWEWPFDTIEGEPQESNPSPPIINKEIPDPELFVFEEGKKEIEEGKKEMEPFTTSTGSSIESSEGKSADVWDRYYDETYKAHYEVSRATGESRWLPKESPRAKEKVQRNGQGSAPAKTTSQSPIGVINQNMGNAFYDSLSLDLSDEEGEQESARSEEE